MYQLYIYTLTNRTTRHRWGQWCHQMGPACCTIQLFRYVQKNNPQPLTSTTEEPYLESFSVTVGMCYRCYFLLSKQPSSLEEVLCTWELRPCCSHEQLQGTSQQEESDSLSNNTHQQIKRCFSTVLLGDTCICKFLSYCLQLTDLNVATMQWDHLKDQQIWKSCFK